MEAWTSPMWAFSNSTIQAPVVVVRGPTVVDSATGKGPADAHKKHRPVFLGDGVLPLPGGLLRPALLQLLGAYKGDALREVAGKLGELAAKELLAFGEDLPEAGDLLPQEIPVALLGGDDQLPVPLVHIDGVEVIQQLIPADGVHIGVEAGAGAEAVGPQGHPLPLGQGLDDLHLGPVHIQDIKLDRALHPVQVVVKAAFWPDKERGGDAGEAQGGGKLRLKGILGGLDCHLRL